jgi:hypothetical protein
VRLHQTTHQRPLDRFQQERHLLRPLPAAPYDTDELLSVVVSSHARVRFETNRYSVPPHLARKTALLRASSTQVRISYQGQEVACHDRCYDCRQLVRHPDHELQALEQRSRVRQHQLDQAFDALGAEARHFHLELCRRPVKTAVHLRRILHLVRLYGREPVVAALRQALQYQTCDAAYVETLLLQERRRRELPSPTQLLPRRKELLDDITLDEPDPAAYDRLWADPPGGEGCR